MKRYISLLFLCVLTFASCQREDPEMTLSTGQITMLAEGGSASVTVTTNYKWTATADPWITIRPSSGDKGSTTVSVTIAANTGSSIRKGAINFVCQDLTRSVSVTQAQPLNQRLTITHNLSTFVVPTLTGNGLTGRVDFGEGEKQNYAAGLKWNYSAAGTHKVVIESAGGTSFAMESVAGVSAIDMSAF